MAECVSTAEAKKEARDARFQGYVECSAKERKGLNKVFHTAFSVVFQTRAIQSPQDLANGEENDGVIEGNTMGKEQSGGCCGSKKKK